VTSAAPRTDAPMEMRIARAIYRAMKRNKDALVQGAPGEGETLIDGTFDLRKISRKVLAAMERADDA